MPVLVQICLGSAVLLGCSFLHIRVITALISRLRHTPIKPSSMTGRQQFYRTSFLFLVLLGSHTVQVYIWAATLLILGALTGYETPIYFSLVSYTTLGYGDVTLPGDFRIFGAMSSVNGILAFGLSTAFLVGFFARLMGTSEET